jgi:hypothetical protein
MQFCKLGYLLCQDRIFAGLLRWLKLFRVDVPDLSLLGSWLVDEELEYLRKTKPIKKEMTVRLLTRKSEEQVLNEGLKRRGALREQK